MACPDCGIVDALDRHASDCPHAIELDLPRLAEGEPPIDPREYEQAERTVELPPAEWHEYRQPGPARTGQTELWMAWTPSSHDDPFDAVIFNREIDALRYAVKNHYQVSRLALGKPISEQTR